MIIAPKSKILEFFRMDAPNGLSAAYIPYWSQLALDNNQTSSGRGTSLWCSPEKLSAPERRIPPEIALAHEKKRPRKGLASREEAQEFAPHRHFFLSYEPERREKKCPSMDWTNKPRNNLSSCWRIVDVTSKGYNSCGQRNSLRLTKEMGIGDGELA